MHALAIALSLVLTAEAPSASAPGEDIVAATAKWHDARVKRLTAEDGWLTLVGLSWLKPGDNTVGAAPGSAVMLPKSAGPEVGTFTLKGKSVTFQPKAGVAVTLKGQPFKGGPVKTDAQGEPDELIVGTVRFFPIQRGDRMGVRVKDADAPARKGFHGIQTFPADAKWRIEGEFIPNSTAVKVAKVDVPNVIGQVESMTSPGKVKFKVGDKELELVTLLEDGSDKLFIIFGDETNKTETYGAGRFLYADPPVNGKVVLDFNRAYNPPCAFSNYATCPLPPKVNKLAARIEAGEKRYGNH